MEPPPIPNFTDKQIIAKTEEILFLSNPKDKNLRTKFKILLGGVIVKPIKEENPTGLNSFFKPTKEQKIKEFQQVWHVNTIEDALKKQQLHIKDMEEIHDQCMNTCIKCVNQKEVLCSAFDCKDYYPRIRSGGDFKHSQISLEKILDIIKEI